MSRVIKLGVLSGLVALVSACASQSDLIEMRKKRAHQLTFQVDGNIDPVMSKMAQNIWACHVFPIKRLGLPDSEIETDHQGYKKYVSYKSTYDYPIDIELDPYDLMSTDVSVLFNKDYEASAKAVPLWFSDDYLECRTADVLSRQRVELHKNTPKTFTEDKAFPDLFESYSDLMLTCFDSRRELGPVYLVDTLVSFVEPKGMITGVNYPAFGKPIYAFQLELKAISAEETQVTYYGHPSVEGVYDALRTWAAHPDQDLLCPARIPLK